ncbi:GGDEF-domain containing protein [Denitratisoma sp. DHT3]|nr:GGDEF-domain containing protein [Denitratisoma sp. DHT3]
MTRSDPSTGILDRYGCLELVTKLASGAMESRQPLAALWIDLDRFRQINESFGHLGGDSVILQIVDRLKERLCGRAELARMGGDEFVCLAPRVDRRHAEYLARELLETIESPLQVGEIQLHPSASVGVALLDADEDPLAFLERSDQAMIAAKRQGGNRFVFSGDEPVPGRLGIMLAREELDIENKLHTALETGGLRLFYQPILGLDGRIEAVEALMRCHVDGEQIPPIKFIPVAEKTGLIIRLGEWSLLQGARYARQLQGQGFSTKVAINVSRAQLLAPKFSQALHGAMLCADVDPDLIELELTESLFMDVSDSVQRNLREARECGVGLAIDDFGTGYSCLANLKDIPATKLKLDRAFVKVLPEDRRALAVVKAMTQLGRELGMTVVAEGVENQGQHDVLAEAGVDAMQGYHHARPMDEDALQGWLQNKK